MGHETVVYTDYTPLEYFQCQLKLNNQQVHWLDTLSDYRLDIRYRPVYENFVSNALCYHPLTPDPSSMPSMQVELSLLYLLLIVLKSSWVTNIYYDQHNNDRDII